MIPVSERINELRRLENLSSLVHKVMVNTKLPEMKSIWMGASRSLSEEILNIRFSILNEGK